MFKKIFIATFVTTIIIFPFSKIKAQQNNIDVVIFTATGCPHCAVMKAYLEQYKREIFPNLNVIEYDIKTNVDNYKKMFDYAKVYKFEVDSVPVILIDDKVIIGEDAPALQVTLDSCTIKRCVSPEKILNDYQMTHPEEFKNNIQLNTNNSNLIGWIVLGGISAALIGLAAYFVLKK